jgi:hypothetical protein
VAICSTIGALSGASAAMGSSAGVSGLSNTRTDVDCDPDEGGCARPQATQNRSPSTALLPQFPQNIVDPLSRHRLEWRWFIGRGVAGTWSPVTAVSPLLSSISSLTRPTGACAGIRKTRDYRDLCQPSEAQWAHSDVRIQTPQPPPNRLRLPADEAVSPT